MKLFLQEHSLGTIQAPWLRFLHRRDHSWPPSWNVFEPYLPKVDNQWHVPPIDSLSLTPIRNLLQEGRDVNLGLNFPPGLQPLQHQPSARPANKTSYMRDKHCHNTWTTHVWWRWSLPTGTPAGCEGGMSSYLYEVEVCEGLSDNCPVMMVICIMDRCLPEIVQENMKMGVLMKQKKINMKQFLWDQIC